jgi:hypothetical protein
MKLIVSILLIALLSFVAGLYLPWWWIALAAALVNVLLPLRPGMAFLSGFIAVFLLWGIMAWGIDSANGSILSQRIAQILPLEGSTVLLILVTALVGGLVGGMAALSGSYLKRAS